MFHTLQTLFILLLLITSSVYANNTVPIKPIDEPLEELSEVEWFIKHPPAGVIFTVREYDEEALVWISARLNYYIYRLRSVHPKLPIVILTHGDEIAALTKASAIEYKKLHHLLQHWHKQDITVHICGTMVSVLGLDEDEFPDYIDVVPFGPSQVKDYLSLAYEHIELELTW